MERLRARESDNYHSGGEPRTTASCRQCNGRKTREVDNSLRDKNGTNERNEVSVDNSWSGRCPGRWSNCARSHKCKAHNQSRTSYFSSSCLGPFVNQYIYSKINLFNQRHYGRPCGLLNGFNIRSADFPGIIRITLVMFLLIYSSIPTTSAAPRQRRHHHFETNLNQSQSTQVDDIIRFLRNELPRTRSPSSRESRLTARSGRSGRRRLSDREVSPTYQLTRILEEMKNATCKPRDTILDAFHELGVDRGYANLYPQCIVVKRCKNGGCCRLEHQQCAAVAFEYKTFYFMQYNSSTIQRDFREDTLCDCVDICELSQDDCAPGKTLNFHTCTCECPKRCPEPFILNERCECDCLLSNRPCKAFLRGRNKTSLSEQECRCVRHGECQEPPCANGQFSKHSCRCMNPSS